MLVDDTGTKANLKKLQDYFDCERQRVETSEKN